MNWKPLDDDARPVLGAASMTCAHLNAAFRRWTWSHSRAVFSGNGKLGALRRILSDIPCNWT